MTLRAKLLLGYGYLVGLLLLVAGSAMIGFLGLSSGIGEVLEENFESIRAAMVMTEALERQDSATLVALIEGGVGDEVFAEQETLFREALGTAAGNVTEADEPTILEAIERDYEAFARARGELVSEQVERPLAAYNERVFPRFAQVKRDVRSLLAINQQAMVEAEREARAAAVQNGTWLGFLVLVALVSLVLLSRALQRQVLFRLEALGEGVASIAIGEHRRLWERGRDELALIAHQVNGLLDRYEELQGRLRGRLSQERRMVLGLLGAVGEHAALFDLAGQRLDGAVDLGDVEDVASDWIRDRGRRLVETGEPVTEPIPGTTGPDGRELRAELLLAPGARPVGWVVR